MTWPGQRWQPGDLGVSGTLFSRAAGSGGAETLERILESRRNRRPGSTESGGGGAGLMADPPPVVFSRPSPPVTVTAGADGPITVSITSNIDGLTHAAVTLNDGPVMWVPVIDGTGATQLVVSVGDVITAANASNVDLVE